MGTYLHFIVNEKLTSSIIEEKLKRFVMNHFNINKKVNILYHKLTLSSLIT